MLQLSNNHKDINEALLKIAAKYSKKVPTVESEDLLLGEIGKEEFIKRLQEVDFDSLTKQLYFISKNKNQLFDLS